MYFVQQRPVATSYIITYTITFAPACILLGRLASSFGVPVSMVIEEAHTKFLSLGICETDFRSFAR